MSPIDLMGSWCGYGGATATRLPHFSDRESMKEYEKEDRTMSGRAVILEGVRTPLGRAFKGSLKDTRAEDLLALTLEELVKRVPAITPDQIGDVIIGCAFPEGEQGMNIARVGVLHAGFPDEIPGITINRFCCSGAQALVFAAHEVLTGFADVVIAGGVESMSRVKMYGFNYTEHPGLKEKRPAAYLSMGLTAENVAERYDVSREEQDKFALRSHEKAVKARSEKRLAKRMFSIKTRVLVTKPDNSTELSDVTCSEDEGPRSSTTLSALGGLKPVFKENGTVTAGNASQMTDGAAALIVTSEEKAEQLGIKPIARIVGATVVGVDPAYMGIGPIPAVKRLLAKHRLSINDIDLVELNEAFAAQAIPCIKEIGIPDEKVNVNGGAIALGHPLGATGARMTVDLITEMEHRGAKRGIVTMCVGMGQGFAMLIER